MFAEVRALVKVMLDWDEAKPSALSVEGKNKSDSWGPKVDVLFNWHLPFTLTFNFRSGHMTP